MRLKRWIIGFVVLAMVGGLVWYFRGRGAKDAHGPAGAEAMSPDARVVPVVAVTVAQRDIPIYLEGLGSVIASSTVTVKSQVDGRLDRVAFREGQEVKKGDLLAQIDSRPFDLQLHQAEAALARDQAQLRGKQVSLDRDTALRKDGLATQQQVDDDRAAVEQLTATTQADRVQIENAQLMRGYARITSPIDGVTGVRLIDAGNIVRQSDPTGLVVITQIDPIAVLFTLPQDDLPRVAKQMAEGPITVEARSRDGEVVLGAGQVALIDNQINQTTATIRLKALFPNPTRALWPNQFVKARVLLMTKKAAVVVPAAVVQRGPQGTFAYVIGPDQKVAVRPVQVESVEGDSAIIAQGLDVGEQVVADGQYQLRPGSRVAPKQPDAPRGKPAPSGAPAVEGSTRPASSSVPQGVHL